MFRRIRTRSAGSFTRRPPKDLADKLGGYVRERAGFGPVTFPIAAPVLHPAIAVDGKAVRGAIGPDGQIPYLPAAATHDHCAVIAERLIDPRTDEVPEFQPLLRNLDIGRVCGDSRCRAHRPGVSLQLCKPEVYQDRLA
jgi:hypothetical protein